MWVSQICPLGPNGLISYQLGAALYHTKIKVPVFGNHFYIQKWRQWYENCICNFDSGAKYQVKWKFLKINGDIGMVTKVKKTRFNKVYAHISKTEQVSEITMTHIHIVAQYK